MRHICCLLAIIAARESLAQKAKPKPFVQYQGKAAAYLQRLHTPLGKLAWREDYPGGFSAWQKAARKSRTGK